MSTDATVALRLPPVIQGGMGIGISGWPLARAVARMGQMGVVSGTAIDSVLVRRLQDGDMGGHLRRAMERFPIPRVAAETLRRYFRPEGRPAGTPYKLLPMYQQVVSRTRQQLTMLARVDCILMGAGIPREIPGALDALAAGRCASLRFDVEGLPAGAVEHLTFDPREHWEGPPPETRRPRFLPIISSNSLASLLSRKAGGGVDGFIIEGPTAGGHNAPPRGEPRSNPRGEPIYGARDEVDLGRVRELGLPFWLAGGEGWPARLSEARQAGAAGIQVGGLFAYCEESGLSEGLKRSVLAHAARGEVDVRTDPRASPTGYPFKVVEWEGDPSGGMERERICDLGYLRTAYHRPGGGIGYRCPSEPEGAYVDKGGRAGETAGRKCLCNALLSNIGQAQVREGGWTEPPLLTSGDDLVRISSFLAGRTHYSAADVVRYLLAEGEG